jgi:putative sterol carrier protein
MEGEMPAYPTPEWVAAAGDNYRANPENEKIFKGMTIFLSFRIEADPAFGLDEPVYFGVHVVDAVLQDDSALMSAADSEEKADFILNATPTIWKRLIKKEEGFISSFMTGKITLAKGEAPKVIALASKSPALVDVFNKVDTEWPDEMSPERLEEYRDQVKEFRGRLGV